MLVPWLQRARNLLYIIIYNIFKTILPIKKDKIVIASNRGKTLQGNLLFINEGLKTEKYNIKVLATDKTNITYKIKLVFNMSNAKFTIIDDFFPLIYALKIRKDAKLIQAWHAVGAFKRVGFSRLGKEGGPNEKSLTHKNYTDVIVSSKNIIENYQEAFGIDKKKIHPLGVPRTDFFFDEEQKENAKSELYNKYPILKGKRIILFAPTFRGNGKKAAHYPHEYINIDKIYKSLKKDEIFIIKNHPFVKETFNIKKEQSDKILDFTLYQDINQLLLITDLLITDYSSTIFEYALLDKPIIFYVPDFEEYRNSRDFYYDFDEYTYGEVCKNFEELVQKMQNTIVNKEKLKKFKEKFLDMCDGKSTQRFIDVIINEKEKYKIGEISDEKSIISNTDVL